MRGEVRLRAGLLCVWSMLAATAHAAAGGADAPPASGREELFRRVFGHAPPPFPVESQVVVLVDTNLRGSMRAVLAADTREMLLEGRSLIALLSQYLRPDLTGQLEQRIDSRGLLDRSAIEAIGLATAFNSRTFEYSLTSAPGMRLPAVVYLTPPLPDPFMVPAVRPAAVSGFVNFNVKGVERKSSLATTSRRSREVAVALDGALNVQGMVLEASAFGRAGAADSWNRGDLRLVYDRPRQALRFMAGDLAYPVTGYQTSAAIAGIGLTKDYTLQPQVLTYWTGDFAFKLDRPAQVQLFSNDSLISTLQLPAGVHDLRRFTPAVGQNDIDIVIEDSAGSREVLHYSFLHDPRLLAKGLSLYSWNAGIARNAYGGAYRYDTSKPVFAGSYRRGVTLTTTLGGYAEAQGARGLLGIHALQGLAGGTLLLDAATSRSRAGRWDAAARIALGMNAGPGRPEAYLAVEYRGERFNMDDALPYPARDALNLQASIAAGLQRGLTGRLSAGYYPERGPQAPARYAAATLFQTWGRHAQASFSLRHQRISGAGSSTAALLGVRVSFTNASGSYRVAKDLERNGVNAQWNSPRRSNASGPHGFAMARSGPGGSREYQGGAGYWGNHGLAEATYLRSEAAADTARNLREETSLRLQGALAFAGDQIALSRPIRENFAIVTGKRGLAGVAMRVDPDRHGSKAGSDWLGAAVVTDLASYRLRRLRVEPVDPPPGATPENMTFQLAPAYKSGVLLEVGRELRIIAIGRLVDATGAPLAYVPIEFRRRGFPEQPAIHTFTGRNGNFQAPDLLPGSYELHVPDTEVTITVSIRGRPEGILRLGDILVPR